MMKAFLAALAVSTCLINLPAVAEDDSVEMVNQFEKLNAMEQSELLEAITGKQWNRLKPDQKLALQKAAVSYSERVLGRNEKGQLKVVRSEAGKQLLKIAGDYLHKLPPSDVPAHGAALAIYGSIPEGAIRVAGKAKVDPRRVRMHSTGFYAAPGEVVVIEVPEEWTQRELKIVISGHRDNIPLKKNLVRTPRSPSRTFPVSQARTKVAATYGGALYVDTGNTPIDADPFLVSFENALPAPTFVRGQTTKENWQGKQRNHPAPYAEFVGENVAISFPSEWIRELDDPGPLLEYWDGVVGLHDELGGYTKLRKMPERINVDCQISAGLFHAGYPTQGPQSKCRGVVDLDKLQSTGNWGWFHELGHEAQRRPDKAWSWNNPYTFDGSIEVTVNLFSTHAFDQLGMTLRGGWTWTANAKTVGEKASRYLAQGKTYAEGNAGDKLAMHLQIRDAFGWDAYRKVLASYSRDQDENPTWLPKGEQAERDAWLIRMSEATGHNLAPFFGKVWGIPLSPDAVEKVAELPTWNGPGK